MKQNKVVTPCQSAQPSDTPESIQRNIQMLIAEHGSFTALMNVLAKNASTPEHRIYYCPERLVKEKAS